MGREKKRTTPAGPEPPKFRQGEGLNAQMIPTDGIDGERLRDHSAKADGVSVEVAFDDLERRLVAEIEAHPYVVGCVAWLTSEPVLRALSGRKAASLVVQKEDFLRPDLPGHRSSLRSLYDSVPGPTSRVDFELGHLCYAADDGLYGVRCVGVRNRSKAAATPRMHHKFAVFLDGIADPLGGGRCEPVAVWTGSFNWSRNATHSLENAVILRDRAIARAYFDEWRQVVSISEPLDWSSEWVEPEWRIGS